MDLTEKKYITSVFVQLFMLNFLFFTGNAIFNMLSPYLSSLGAGKGYIGFFMNVNALEVVFYVILLGKFSNKINKKKALISGFILLFFTMIIMFIVNDNLVILLILRVISGISFVFSFTMVTNFAFDIIPKEKRTSGFALFGISGVLANPIGSFIGEKIIHNIHSKYLFIIIAFITVIILMITIFLKIPRHKHHGKESISFWTVIRRKELLPFILISFFIVGGVFSVYTTFMPNFSKDRIGIANLSNFFIPFALVAISIRILFSKHFDKINKKRTIVFCLFFIFISLIVTIFLYFKVQLFIIGFIYGLGHSIIYPIFNTIFVENGSEDEKIILSNTFISINTFGNVSIATFLGFVGDLFGTVSIFIVMAIVLFVTILTSIFYKSKQI